MREGVQPSSSAILPARCSPPFPSPTTLHRHADLAAPDPYSIDLGRTSYRFLCPAAACTAATFGGSSSAYPAVPPPLPSPSALASDPQFPPRPIQLPSTRTGEVWIISVSVGEVRRAPVIAMAPLRCMVVSCLITFAEPRSLGPGCSLTGGLHHTSAP